MFRGPMLAASATDFCRRDALMFNLRFVVFAWGLAFLAALAPGSAAADDDESATLEKLNQAIARNPRQADAYLYRGLIWQGRGELERAIADFSETIRFAPKSADGYVHRAIA